jgi:serine acetyltransferase
VSEFETTVIGKHVSVYRCNSQELYRVEKKRGNTKKKKKKERHPTVEDRVIIYTNAPS